MPSFKLPVVAALLAIATVQPAFAGSSDMDPMLRVTVDQAKVLKVDRPSGTVIIGNPSIVDVTVHDARTFVLTGKSFGITNLVVLDVNGKTLIDESVVVTNSERATVRVYRQAERTTFACAPECEPTATIGDEGTAFQSAISQYSSRQSMAKNAAE